VGEPSVAWENQKEEGVVTGEEVTSKASRIASLKEELKRTRELVVLSEVGE